MNVGESIKYWRTKKRMTQKQLAEISNISEISIRKYEANDRSPKIETLSKLAKAMNITIGDLDPEYTVMVNDKNDALNLVSQLENFIVELPKMNISEESKQNNLCKATAVLEKEKKLIDIIDTGISNDKEMKEILTEKEILNQEVQKAQLEIDAMLLFMFHLLNDDGQTKAIEQVALLTKIPEYQKDSSQD